MNVTVTKTAVESRDAERREILAELRESVDSLLANRKSLRILEAGCGSCEKVSFRQAKHIVGIDTSEKQLMRNTTVD